jgi:hypothetical protein
LKSFLSMLWFSIFTSLISTQCVLFVCCFHTLVSVVVFVVQSLTLFRALVMHGLGFMTISF